MKRAVNHAIVRAAPVPGVTEIGEVKRHPAPTGPVEHGAVGLKGLAGGICHARAKPITRAIAIHPQTQRTRLVSELDRLAPRRRAADKPPAYVEAVIQLQRPRERAARAARRGGFARTAGGRHLRVAVEHRLERSHLQRAKLGPHQVTHGYPVGVEQLHRSRLGAGGERGLRLALGKLDGQLGPAD